LTGQGRIIIKEKLPYKTISKLAQVATILQYMAVIVVQIEESNNKLTEIPLRCPHCGSYDIQRMGRSARKVKDVKPVKAVIHRFFCNHCHSTFRIYPKGVTQSRYSERVRRLAALIWLMGLSVRDVAEVFEKLGVHLNRMIIWREGQKLVNELNSLKYLNPNLRFSIDNKFGIENRPNGDVLLALSLINGKKTVLGTLNTHDPNYVISWLKPILKEMDLHIVSMGTREF
jgi:transposase-like protein